MPTFKSLFKKISCSIAAISIVSHNYALPLNLKEVSISTGYTKSVVSEIYETPSFKLPIFNLKAINPYISASVKKEVFNYNCLLVAEGSYIISSGKDHIKDNNGHYETYSSLWDFKTFLYGPAVTNHNIRFGIGGGYGNAIYSSHTFSGETIPVDRSHGMMPLIAISIGDPTKNAYEFNFKYGTNTMADEDFRYSPYIETSFSYFINETNDVSNGFNVRYVNWKNPISLVSGIPQIPKQNTLFIGYEIRVR